MNYPNQPPISDAQLLHEGKQQGLTQAEFIEIDKRIPKKKRKKK
jgi:hypothetical protein